MQRRTSKRCPVSTLISFCSTSSVSLVLIPLSTSIASSQAFAGCLGSPFNRQTKVSFPVTHSSGVSSIAVSSLSYTALGLLPSLNPRAKGGAEFVPDITLLPKSASSAIKNPSASVPTGHGRILRDKHGNVVDVRLNEEDQDEEIKDFQEDSESQTPWGAPMEDWGNEGKAMPEIEAKTEVIKGTHLLCIALLSSTDQACQLSSPMPPRQSKPPSAMPRLERPSGCASLSRSTGTISPKPLATEGGIPGSGQRAKLDAGG